MVTISLGARVGCGIAAAALAVACSGDDSAPSAAADGGRSNGGRSGASHGAQAGTGSRAGNAPNAGQGGSDVGGTAALGGATPVGGRDGGGSNQGGSNDVGGEPSSEAGAGGAIDVPRSVGDGPLLWWRGDRNDRALISTNAVGQILVAGAFSSSELDLDPGAATQIAQRKAPDSDALHEYFDLFVLRLDAERQLDWSFVLPGSASVVGFSSIAATPDGGLIASGALSGTADLDPGPGEALFEQEWPGEHFLVAYDALGHYRWGFTNGYVGPGSLRSIAVAADGSVFVLGPVYTEGVDPDLAPEPEPGTSPFFLTKLDSDGKFVWATRIAGQPSSMALLTDGGVALGGTFSGTVDFDTGAGSSERTAENGSAAFVQKLGADRQLAWVYTRSLPYESPGSTASAGPLAAAPDGGVVAVGRTTFAFIAQLSSQGTTAWEYLDWPTYPEHLQVSAAGEITVAGRYEYGFDIDPTAGTDLRTLVIEGESERFFVARLTSSGQYDGARAYWGNEYASGLTGLGTDKSGHTLLAGVCDVHCALVNDSEQVTAEGLGDGDAFIMQLPLD